MDNYTQSIDKNIDASLKWNKKSFVNIAKANEFTNNHIINGGVDTTFCEDKNNKRVYEKAWLNHYFTKSWEDFVERMLVRGNLGNSYRSFDNFFDQNPDMQHLEKELMSEMRNKHLNNVQYISRKNKLVSGGNLNIIKNLSKKRDS
jgi:hypothetical protein